MPPPPNPGEQDSGNPEREMVSANPVRPGPCVSVPVEPSAYILIEMSKWFPGDTSALKRRQCYAAMIAAAKEE